MTKKLTGDALIEQGAQEFADAMGGAQNSASYVTLAAKAATKVFGVVEVTAKQLSDFASRVCDKRGISEDKDKRKSPMSRIRKVARNRVALPGMIEAVQGDKRFEGNFNWHEGLKVATLLNKEPKISAAKLCNAYYNTKASASSKTLQQELQSIANKLCGLKGIRKGTPNGKLVAACIKAFDTAEYDVE
jgi:hypothetical protein